ncbi:MAG: efflux RND transporter periplasmic adaptor subunit [Calditrichaeota bacterium]|nr:efflux RND transporter periplasmic adaptor subunit [Calditrichota bacterium]
MDKPLDKTYLQLRRNRRIALYSLVVIIVLASALGIKSMLTPTLSIDKIRTAVVDRGSVDAVILSSGRVVPEFEQVISCPFDSRIVRVESEPGTQLTPGHNLLLLDDRLIRLDIDRLQDEIALKHNQREQLELEINRQLDEMNSEKDILSLELKFQEAMTEQVKALEKIYAATAWSVKQAELEEEIKKLKKEQNLREISRLLESNKKRVDGLQIEMRLLQQQLRKVEDLINRATVKSNMKGVLVWIASEEGATIRQGEILARIANLERFRIEATVSDLNSARIAVGLAVKVKANNEILNGNIHNILPNIEGGIITLIIHLADPSHNNLRSNLSVDVYIITESRDDVLRVNKGPFVNGPGEQEVFVIEDTRAIRRKATIGIAGMDKYEVIDGLQEGETVILSGTDDYNHLETIRIKH